MQEKSCENCQKKFSDYRSNNRRFCSRLCKNASQLVDKTTTCQNCGSSFTYKHYNVDKYCSKLCISQGISKAKQGVTPWNKGRVYLQISGTNHWNWKGGGLRGGRGAAQRRFRNAVLKRDDYTCVECGATNTKLYADHIKPWSEYPDLREDVTNGRTLCYDCNYITTYVNKDWQVQRG